MAFGSSVKNNIVAIARTWIAKATHLTRMHRKLAAGSAAMLAVLVAPLAVQAMTGSLPLVGSDDPEPVSAPLDAEVHADLREAALEAQADVQGFSTGGSQSGSGQGSNSEVDVTVNGQDVPVPDNGSVHKTLTDGSSKTIVDIKVNGHQSVSSNSNSSTTIEVNSHSISIGDEPQDDPTAGGRHPARR